ncbi:MAG TPA: MerC family mercury resistance protein [Myxococcus sp.]|nr:MerC family mercury resistance protein [Myxococcus sp.]
MLSGSAPPAAASSRWDGVGQALSSLCIAHCLLLPLALGLLPLAAAEALEGEAVHHGLLVLTAMGALAAFVPGWRLHRHASVPVLAALGLALLSAGAFLVPEDATGPWEPVLTGGGGAVMLLAHGHNRALRRRGCPS